jgi:hypothetical protein
MTRIFALVLAAMSWPAFAIEIEELYGTYSLVGTTRQIQETGEVIPGTREKGFITYGRDGRMLVLIIRDERPNPGSIEKMTDQHRAELFRSMVSYGKS